MARSARHGLLVFILPLLVDAREWCQEARKLVALIPESRRRLLLASTYSLEVVPRAWFDGRAQTVEPVQNKKTQSRLGNDAFLGLGRRPIAEIDAPELLVCTQTCGCQRG